MKSVVRSAAVAVTNMADSDNDIVSDSEGSNPEASESGEYDTYYDDGEVSFDLGHGQPVGSIAGSAAGSPTGSRTGSPTGSRTGSPKGSQ